MNLKAFTACFSGAIALWGSGCGLFKQGDAVNPASRSLRQALPQSGLSRTSGESTRIRLLSLFPDATRVLDPKDFSFEAAEGINRALGAETRPVDALAQMALRKKVATLCTNNLAESSSQIFRLDTGNQLLDGETPPQDPVTRLAVATARNVWLHPYVPSDPEVQELIALYNDVSKLGTTATGESGAAGGRRALCQAALLSPQFWVGTSEIDDAAKRVSIELFRRVPKMQEMKDFIDKKISIEAYFDRLLADSTAKNGFVGAINDWHEKWLGFREFIDTNTLFQDRRSNSLDGGAFGASNKVAIPFTIDPRVTSAAPQAIKADHLSIAASATSCTSNASQAFDPDTKMIAWEHFNYETGAYNYVGGFFRSGSNLLDSTSAGVGNMNLSEVANALAGLGNLPIADPATRIAALRDLCSAQPTTIDQTGETWRQCNGLISLSRTSATRASSTLTRLAGWIYAYDLFSRQSDTSRWPMSDWCGSSTAAGLASCITRYQASARNTRNNLIDDFISSATRIRTYSASGVGLNRLKALLNTLGTGPIYDAFISRFREFASVSPAPAAYQGAPWSVTGPFNGEVGGDGTTIEIDGTQVKAGPGITNLATDVATGGWFYVTALSENRVPNAIGSTNLGEPRYNYSAGPMHTFVSTAVFGMDAGFKPLPIEDPTVAPGGWTKENRRARRFGGITNTWQDGYSTVKLWTTGGTVAVCNNADRLWASCFYRPQRTKIPEPSITSFRADQAAFWVSFYAWMPDSAMHPQVSSAFYCGLPSPDALRVRNAAAPNAPFEAVKFAQLNTVASNIDLQLAANAPAGTAIGNEVGVFSELYQQLREEPMKLIDHLVLDRDDYREILTSTTTYGNSCLKFFYDSQGFYLPSHSQAIGQACRGPGGPDVRFSAGAAIPIGHITSVDGTHQGETTGVRARMWQKLYGTEPSAIPPRLYSGILTMPAFVAPVSTTARGIASRYFARILCDLPSFYDPSQDPVGDKAKAALHQSFVSERKHLQPACVQCHRNLDPLASALSWTFQGLLTRGADGFALNKLGGEGAVYDYLGELDAVSAKQYPLTGIRHGAAPPSEGAFMGERVSGIADLARKISNSDRFAACATQTAFENVFGRSVQFSDQSLFKDLVNQFKDPSKNNYRYIDLLKTMIKSDVYQRKN